MKLQATRHCDLKFGETPNVSTQEPGRTWTGRIESSNLTYFFGPPSQTKIPSATGHIYILQSIFSNIETLRLDQGGFNFANLARHEVEIGLESAAQNFPVSCDWLPILAQNIWLCSDEDFIAYLEANVSQENWVVCHVLRQFSIILFQNTMHLKQNI